MTNYDIATKNYEYTLIHGLNKDGCISNILSDVEIIVDELRARLNGRKLYYIDNEGYIVQISYENGMFMGFDC